MEFFTTTIIFLYVNLSHDDATNLASSEEMKLLTKLLQKTCNVISGNEFLKKKIMVGTQTCPFSKFTRIEQKCVLVLGRSPQTSEFFLPGFLAACASASLN